jgi:3-deoxy-D-manno-octulosonic acid kinase
MDNAGIETAIVTTANGAIVFDRLRLPQADARLFDAAALAGVQVSGRGGRGAAWFVDTAAGPAVLRHYRRGGAMARLSRDHYLWTRGERTRSFREFTLLAELRGLDLPVPAPLAARYERTDPLRYRADILIARIPGTLTLAQLVPGVLDDAATMDALGRVLGRFHRLGVHHADLNAHNLLRDADGQWWVIDFDRGERRDPDPAWWETRLERLQRSLRKVGAWEHPAADVAWRALRRAHDAETGHKA